MTIVFPQSTDSIENICIEKRVIAPFSDVLVDFVDDVSKHILNESTFKQYPELMALAFWMRRGHIKKLQYYFMQKQGTKLLLGRGIVFHLAPSNVDTIFIYSWFLSLLVGNSNIVRISDKKNIQTDLLLKVLTLILQQHKYEELQTRVGIIRYGHDDEVTSYLSRMADTRVIWGGDRTIEHIRTIPIKATATELTFADKFSFAIIDSKTLCEEKKLMLLIKKFYNDTFWFGQMACSSIRSIVWVGSKEDNIQAKNRFWNALETYVKQQLPEEITPADIINKLVAECSMAIEQDGIVTKMDTPYINRIQIEDLSQANTHLHCGTGLFYECEVDGLSEVFQHISKKYQTIAYYGFEKEVLFAALQQTLPYGIDRVVPIGKSLEFSHVWDGYDLFESFCREVEVWS